MEPPDLGGYSLGAGVALQVATTHPEVVHKLVRTSVTYDKGGFHPGMLEGIDQLQPEHLMGSPWHEEYLRLASRPADFPTLGAKVKYLNQHIPDWPAETVAAIPVPALILIGDSDIGVRPRYV